MKRRKFLRAGLAGAAGAAAISEATVAGANTTRLPSEEQTLATPLQRDLKGNIHQSVCKWCYRDMTVAELAAVAAEIGLKSVELLDPDDWPAVTDAGLICAMANGPAPEGKNALTDGFNHTVNHEWLVPGYERRLAEVAEAGFPNLICFSGNRAGISDAEGLKNCLEGLKQIVPAAEKHGVTICMELLNSRIDHIDYQCDRTEWGLRLVDMVGSDRFKLLYDIYHMQIMEGDIIRTIRSHHEYFAHYHTGGNPGRNEIDHTQELNYRAIMEAILETGFEGYVAQEFIPTRDPKSSLAQAAEICDA